MLYVLMGRADSITVEDVGELSQGSEFTFRRGSVTEVHQLKRQNRMINNWSAASLNKLDVWASARHHVERGREFHFMSEVPARALSELCDNARRAPSLDVFTKEWLPNQSMRDEFTELSAPKIFESPDKAWQVLRGIRIGWPDERDLLDGNAALAELLLAGADGRLAAVGLGDLLLHNLGVELSAVDILNRLPQYGLRPATAVRGGATAEQINAVTDRWATAVGAELLRPVLPRPESDELLNLAEGGEEGLVFVIGAAGGGKSVVMHQAVGNAREQGMPVLAFRLDRVEPFSSTAELGRRLGLEVSPVSALAAAASDRPSLLVVDQLDAVSVVSGRMPRNFDVIAWLIREATAFEHMRVVLACRKFDIDNDERIRRLRAIPDSETVSVGPLSDEQVDSAVGAMGLDAAAVSSHQRTLLRSPLHLVLLAAVADGTNALDFASTAHLFDAYWDRKRRDVRERREGTRFGPVVSAVAEAISQRQRLSVPMTVLDREDLGNDADVLVSEHVLVRDGRELAFFHEAFFDYAFARHWGTRGESLVEFLTGGEQELFRRAQVRQIMTHLRSVEPDRFVDEVKALLLSNDVRFHIKDAAMAVLAGIADPTRSEGVMVIDAAATHPPFEARLWARLRTAAWFARFNSDRHVDGWLRGDAAEQSRALDLMGPGAQTAPGRVAELLAGHEHEPAIFARGLRWISRFANLDESRSLFDLALKAVRAGDYSVHEGALWILHGAEDSLPDRAIELLVAYLVERPTALAQNGRGKVAALEMRDHQVAELVKRVADDAPREFCDALLSYLLRVTALTALDHDSYGQREDAHFCFRWPDSDSDAKLDDVLFSSMAAAIRTLVSRDPDATRPTLERLAVEPYDSAQWLLYQGLIAGGAAYADWAAEVLLQGRHRLLSGYASNGVWTAREVMQAISPHLNVDLFSRLEAAVRDLRFSWEKRSPGWYAFCLLSGLDEQRLSDTGRRRLGELRRACGMEQPEEPRGVAVGFVDSPIKTSAAEYMSDDNWLQAMTKHVGEAHNWTMMTGGAMELSYVLRERTKQDPARFARLALRLTADINPAYGDGLLMGLGEAEPIEDEDVVFVAVRHIASLGHVENDRWLGSAIRPYLKTVPLDIVELIRDRMLSTSDPSDDGIRMWSDDGKGQQVPDILVSGINTARGSLVEAMSDLLVYDTDGARTGIVAPALDHIATDPSVPVRACAARVIGNAVRHEYGEATQAFWKLVETHDALLATRHVLRLVIYFGSQDSATIRPIIERMLSSEDPRVRESGGELAAFAAMEWEMEDLLAAVLDGEDTEARQGAAKMCAHRIPHTGNVPACAKTLTRLATDADEEVRKQVSEVAAALRGHALRPFERVLKTLMASPAFADAVPQLLITLEQAPDRVDDLVLLCAQRFVDESGKDAGDIRTHAAGNAQQVGELIIRGLAQSRSPAERSALLDVLDGLLVAGAHGIEKLIGESER
ncbi:NACHT domain-containing protein [Parasphingorhabdus pacifica]